MRMNPPTAGASATDRTIYEIALAASSQTPLIGIDSGEEQRVIYNLITMAGMFEPQRSVYVWDAVRGLGKADMVTGAIESYQGMDFLTLMDSIPRFKVGGTLTGNGRADQAIYVVLDPMPWIESDEGHRAIKNAMASILSQRKTIIAVQQGLVIPFDMRNESTLFPFPLPDDTELQAELATAVANCPRETTINIGASVQASLIQAMRGLPSSVIQRTLAMAIVRHRSIGPETIDIVRGVKERAVSMSGVVDYESRPLEPWEIGGHDLLMEHVAMQQQLMTPEARAFGCDPPSGLFLVGFFGVGKTSVCRTISGNHMPLLIANVSKWYNDRLGGTEASIRAMEQIVEASAPCTLVIDEIDKMGLKEQGSSGTNGRVLQELLIWFDRRARERGVYLVATCNDVSRVPEELIRRFGVGNAFFLGLPNRDDRVRVLEIHLRKRGRADLIGRLDLAYVADQTSGYSPAELEQVITTAIAYAFIDGVPQPGNEHLIRAAQQITPQSSFTSGTDFKAYQGMFRPSSRHQTGDNYGMVLSIPSRDRNN